MRNVTASTASNSITVTWLPPRITQGVIMTYEILLFRGRILSQRFHINGTNLTFTIPDLDAYTNYTIRMHATSRAGEGPLSPRLTVLTDEDGLCIYR